MALSFSQEGSVLALDEPQAIYVDRETFRPLRRGPRAVRDAERSLVAGAVRVRVHASPPGTARSARVAGPRTWPDQPRPTPDRRRRRAGPGGICRGWSAAAQAGAGPASPMAGGAGSHGVSRRLRPARRGSRSPGGHDRVDEALDIAQSERPQRALSSPGARHRVRPAAGGRGSPTGRGQPSRPLRTIMKCRPGADAFIIPPTRRPRPATAGIGAFNPSESDVKRIVGINDL